MDVLNRSKTLSYFIYSGGNELEPDFEYNIMLTTYQVNRKLDWDIKVQFLLTKWIGTCIIPVIFYYVTEDGK